MDLDDYYWKKTTPPYQIKIPLIERNKNLKIDFKKFKNIVLSGSMVSWGKEWETAFDFVFFIRLDNAERIKRLEKREIERYGDQLLTDRKIQKNSEAFLEWANQYEDPNFQGRSLVIHTNWMKLLNCKVLSLDGASELDDKVNLVLKQIKMFYKDL